MPSSGCLCAPMSPCYLPFYYRQVRLASKSPLRVILLPPWRLSGLRVPSLWLSSPARCDSGCIHAYYLHAGMALSGVPALPWAPRPGSITSGLRLLASCSEFEAITRASIKPISVCRHVLAQSNAQCLRAAAIVVGQGRAYCGLINCMDADIPVCASHWSLMNIKSDS